MWYVIPDMIFAIIVHSQVILRCYDLSLWFYDQSCTFSRKLDLSNLVVKVPLSPKYCESTYGGHIVTGYHYQSQWLTAAV